VLRHAVAGHDPAAIGVTAARHLLDGAGGRDILERS
jgi:hypothetical protein